MATQHNMKLKRIIGLTTNSRNSFICQPQTGNLIYIAGCVVVIYNPKLKSQQHLITDSSKQTITTLAITDDGRFLAASNCNANGRATIFIWDLNNLSLLAELNGHQFEISCMCFSANNEILVSVGGQLDQVLCLWNWRKRSKLASHKMNARIRAISFSADSSYFVAVGESYVKFWYIQLLAEGSASPEFGSVQLASNLSSAASITISSRGAILGEQKRNNFCDVKCGRGLMADSTFCITKTGLLCELNSKRLLHKWVDLRTTSASCLTISESLLVIGCADGVSRCFNTSELRFIKNLGRPHSLQSGNLPETKGATKYPNVICVGLYEPSTVERGSSSVACVYDDRSIYIWGLTNSNKGVKKYSALYHSSCIWGIDMYPNIDANSQLVAPGSFITCSSDDTIRVWSLKLLNEEDYYHLDQPTAMKECSKIIFTDSSYKFLCDLEGLDASQDEKDKLVEQQNYDSNEGLRCLRISANGNHLAVGSRSGSIRVFDLKQDARELKNIAAHDAEVLCLEYSEPKSFDGFYYLASSSRDKLIHIFDAANDYSFLQTIDDHSSSITALRFVNNRASDQLQLISCGADKKIIFRTGVEQANEQLSFVASQLIEGKQTFYDMEVDSEFSSLMTACQDGMIRLFNVAQVKYQSSFKGSSSEEGTLIKIALDPSCTFLATSSTDKSINIYDYQRAECIASITWGLSDLMTDLKFSPDGRHLVACSGDGCIFIWNSPAEIANAISGDFGCFLNTQAAPTTHKQQYSATNKSKTASSCVTTSSSAEKVKNLLDWNKPLPVEEIAAQHLSEEEDDCEASKMNEAKYQVQSSYIDQAEIQDLEYGNETFRGAIGSGADQSVSTLTAASGSSNIPSSRFERTRHSQTNGNNNRYSSNNQASLVNSMAKFYQSRENLDKISSREKYVSESFNLKDEGKHLSSRPKNTVNARAQDNPTVGSSIESKSESITKGLAGESGVNSRRRMFSPTSFVSSKAQVRSLSKSTHALNGATSPKLDKDKGEGEKEEQTSERMLAGSNLFARSRRISSPKPTMPRQTARASSKPTLDLEHKGRATGGNHLDEPPMTTPTNPLSTQKHLISSKSECKLEVLTSPSGKGVDKLTTSQTKASNTTNQKSIYCEKLDLSKLSPTTVAITQELCQYVVEELQAISKYATRLHQRVQATGNRSLSNMLARGVQNSMDILSIVPPRNSHHHEFQSQENLSPSSVISRRSKMQAQQQARRPLGSGSVLGAWSTGSKSRLRQTHSPTIVQLGAQNRVLSPSNNAPLKQTSRARTLDSDTESRESVGPTTNSTDASNLNIDQVLEAYSDRLFKMVQERMVEQQQQK